MPTTTLSGEIIASDADIVATVSVADKTTEVTGKPGSEQHLTVKTAQGNNTIGVVCSVLGDKGPQTTIDVFTGVDVPVAPRNLKADVQADNMTVILTWDAPDAGANGRYFTPDGITYVAYIVNGFSAEPIGSVADKTTLTYTLDDGAPSQSVNISVVATNAAGTSLPAETVCTMGTPFKLPMTENFAEDKITYNPIMLSRPSEDYYGSNLYYVTPYQISPSYELYDHICIVGFSSRPDSKGLLLLPKFQSGLIGGSGSGANLMAKFEIWTGEHAAPMRFYISSYDKEPQLVASSTDVPQNGWQTLTFEVPEEHTTSQWSQISVESDYATTDDYMFIYSYELSWKYAGAVDDERIVKGSVTAEHGSIIATGLEGMAIAIYTPDGRCVASVASASDYETFPVAPGIYMVHTNGHTYKLAVR